MDLLLCSSFVYELRQSPWPDKQKRSCLAGRGVGVRGGGGGGGGSMNSLYSLASGKSLCFCRCINTY